MRQQRIGFVSTRFHGTDGVSLESAKWAEVFWDHKHVSFWYAGKLDRDPQASMLVPEAYFEHPDNAWINEQVFGRTVRSRAVTDRIHELSEYLKNTIYEFVSRFSLDILCVQNALSMPMHIPLGVALTQFIAETKFPTIAHHHDFYWERTRFYPNSVGDYLAMAFPPNLPSIQHVTINTAGQQELSHRKGISSMLVPNVLNFDRKDNDDDGYADDFREQIGVGPDDILVLQPTRVVPRKGIEHAIMLVARLNDPRCKLVVTHSNGDEGHEYMDALADLANYHGVELLFVDQRIGDKRGVDDKGRKIYSLWDAYKHADLITYPSKYEGFGNGLLEAFYCRKPVVVNRYSIFIEDIEPKGFRVIAMDGYVTGRVAEEVKRVLHDPRYRQEMVEHNFAVAKRFFSYSVLRRKLRSLVANFTGMNGY